MDPEWLFSQFLTAKDGRRTERVKHLEWPLIHKIGIQMKQKELTKTFMMISH